MTEKAYYRIKLGEKNSKAQECHEGGFIGIGYSFNNDISSDLNLDRKSFIGKHSKILLENNLDNTKASAVMCSGIVWRFFKDIKQGDIVLAPISNNDFIIGQVSNDYQFDPNSGLPQQRQVKWFKNKISLNAMSETFRNSNSSRATLINISQYYEEIEGIINSDEQDKVYNIGNCHTTPVSNFTFEKYLEEFLVQNWEKTDLANDYDIYESNGATGQQFKCDVGIMDILAISKDKKEFAVIELKRGQASDETLGQVQRYMGYVKDELCENNQTVKGIIIALEEDLKLKRALSVTNNIDFYRYKMNFELDKSV
jgi:restriction system protein